MWTVSPPTVRPPQKPKLVPPAHIQWLMPLAPTAVSSCRRASRLAGDLPLCRLAPQLSNQPLHSSLTISGLSGHTRRVACSLRSRPVQPLRNSATPGMAPMQV